ncbi:MAG: response regulator transcription factor [Flavobacteriales bacterium]|jgi:DNA-binding NarL/FixJ family response regulator|nr:response regulator transcription factor [Flavobacteriales bacterium]
MITVLVVDDHQMMVEGITALLAGVHDITIQGSALTGEEALEALARKPARVVLLDIGLPGMDGLDTCAVIRERWPATKVLAVSMHDGHHMISGMLERGASGYVLKNVGREELIEAIRAVDAGGTHLSRRVTEVLIEGPRTPPPAPPSLPPVEITERESEVLGLVAKELTTAEIARQLKIGVSTVETHRRKLMEKLGARNSAGLVRIALERGLVDQTH